MKKKMLFKIPLLSLVIWLLIFLISPLSHSLSHALQDDTVESLLPAVKVGFSKSSSREQETLVGFDAIGLRKMGNGRRRVAVKRIMRKETGGNDQESSRISGKNKRSSKSFQTLNHQETISSTGSHSKRLLKKHEETQRLLKAAREIANLMHKDYKEWAHRKPPINNYEPVH